MSTQTPAASDIRRWRRHLADERGTAEVMRRLAAHTESEQEREILLELAGAEERHLEHWAALLGLQEESPLRLGVKHSALAFMAGTFLYTFVLMLLQRSEAGSSYGTDADAIPGMAADELVHEEVLRALAARGRERLSGNFRAGVFGANDGLVSNLALVVGMSATGVSNGVVLAAGVAGLLAGALSMGAGEYISVRSARELLQASMPNPRISDALDELHVDVNELALVYRARGMSPQAAQAEATRMLESSRTEQLTADVADVDLPDYEAVGSAWGAAISSFCFFSSGALIPILPYLLGLSGSAAMIVAVLLVGLTLLGTGAAVGLLSGASMLRRGLRQLAIGYAAAAVTYLLGLAFGAAGVG